MKMKYIIIGLSLFVLGSTSASWGANIKELSHSPLERTGETQYKLIKEVKLRNGKHLIKFQQIYQSVPVFAFTVSAEKKGDHYINWHGKKLIHIKKDIHSMKALLSKEDALDILMKESSLPDNQVIEYKEGTEYVYQTKDGKAHLVYEVNFFVPSDDPKRPFAIIDAHSGEILDKWEGLTTRQATGPGGNLKTGKYFFGTDYPALEVTDKCAFSSKHVDTINLNHGISGGIYHIKPCTDNPTNTVKEINGAFSPLNDAHAFGEVTYNLYKEWYGIPPLTFKVRMRVHYLRNYENAFWNGREMTFGDGYIRFYPLTNLDVSAHEISHGFTQQNSNLVYRNQSGGMNEAFSDISGEAAEYFFYEGTNRTNDWLVGAEEFKAPNAALRYFEVPERDGRSIGDASKYRAGMDVHYSSGVYNRAFFLLSHTEEWNVHKAFDIFVLANQIYWQRNATFNSGGCGLRRAAKDLEYNTNDVIKAFNTVGVDASCGEDPDPGPEPEPDPIELKSGQNTPDLSGDKGSKRYYFITVPPHQAMLQLNTAGPIGDVDMFVRFDKIPTRTEFDCKSDVIDKNKGVCYMSRPKPGKYFILLYGYKAYERVQLKPRIY